ncbi:hypothetical protein ATCC90586_003497 [Pythium insidiosum]|nr:hypothetical protein ATCC90586_003497 [Pythium insidiosum]
MELRRSRPRPPPGAPPGPPAGPPPAKKAAGVPGPPPGAPPGPPPGPPPQPPKGPPPAKTPPEEPKEEPALPLEAIQRLLKRGRLNFKLLEARHLKKKGGTEKKFSADPYIKLKIGTHPMHALELKSKTLKKSTSTVNFHEEVVFFDITKPDTLITDGDVPLKLEIYDENLISDELIGEVRFSALRYFDGKPHRETLPLSLPSTSESCGELEVEIKMDIALVGMISIVLLEGRNLKSMELIGKQDPYCKLTIGQFTKRGKTVQKGGRNPYFGEEELLFWITEDLWVERMRLSVFDEDIGSDDLIGDATFSVLHFMERLGPQDHVIPIKNSGQNAGDVAVKIEFFPAGMMTIQCHAARQLRSVDAIGRQDPYTKITLEGKATKSIKKTKTDTDGGREPEWENEIFTFEIVDQYNMIVEVWDEDSVGNDDLIGSATVSLLPIFRYGYVDDWLNLWHKGKFGNKDPAGQLHLEMSFVGPPGVAYPQHQIGMDKFTEKERRTKETANQPKDAEQPEDEEPLDSEFSEEEILGAFRFLDLDKNNFIGAAELRHLLICMGELITDEEIDEMIKLCDVDGDGQVSFDEFRRMVIHPDPGSPEFATASVDDDEEQRVDVKLITRELTPEQKARQLEIKEEKKRLMKNFVDDNNPTLDFLMRRFRAMNKDDLDFDDFCTLFEVEATGEYRRLFGLYTPDGQSEEGADLREILLGIVNFMESKADRQQRVKFCFDIFDDDHNGFITEDELINILKANHMTSDASQVRKKAETIMRQADDNGDGKMSLEEFAIIAKKFPNLLFPSYDSNQRERDWKHRGKSEMHKRS